MEWIEHTTNADNARETLFVDFPDIAYFNVSFMSPTLKPSLDTLNGKQGLIQCHPWEFSFPSTFVDPVEKIRTQFAELINTSANNVAVVNSAGYAIATVVKHLEPSFTESSSILILQDQYTSNNIYWHKLALKKNAKMIVVKQSDTWSTDVIETLEKEAAKGTPVTLVALPNCHWCNGIKFDLEAISKVCKMYGSKLFIDVTQSLGMIPFDIEKVPCDYLTCAAYKWLFCPYGTAFFYVNEAYHNEEPLEEHGFARKNVGFTPEGDFDIDALLSNNDTYTDGARRFDAGEQSKFMANEMVSVALSQVKAWTVDNYGAMHTQRVVDYICDKAVEIGMGVIPKSQRSPHIVGICFPSELNVDAAGRKAFQQELKKKKIYLTIRGKFLRVACHVFTKKEHADQLLEACQEFMEKLKQEQSLPVTG